MSTSPHPVGSDAEALRRDILPQIEALSIENSRLLQAVIHNEQRFRSIAKSVWAVQEDERRRLARELHDGLGQVLTALANQLQRLRDESAAALPTVSERLDDALQMTRGALQDTRELSRLLRPALLDDLGLDAALKWLARVLGERTGLPVRYQSTLGEQRLSCEIETLVFRVAQEALTNVVRHARARHGDIRLVITSDGLQLDVRDDGCGFDLALLDTDRFGEEHAGVRSMRDRARLFGGSLCLASRPGHGTCVTLEMPLHAYRATAPS